ncbi:hypothetical protein JOM56_002999 [Amanita muscaria]
MSEVENQPSAGTDALVNALKLGNRRKPCTSDPLVHHGRHFGRTVHAMCSVQALITNGILLLGEDGEVTEESLTAEQRKEYNVFRQLLQMVPRLNERLMEGSEEECIARSDDTKSLKGIVLDWITPQDEALSPPISRNSKTTRGYHHPITGALLCPAGLDWNDREICAKLSTGEMAVRGDQWPLLVYAKQKFDPEEPWDGLFRSELLVWAYKHIFTSPSSVEKEVKATRSGNACIHGMTRVTSASLAYVATQLCFALSSSSVFCRSDTSTDSERFYESVADLLNWWNCQVFPSYVTRERGITKQSALAKLKEKRARLKQIQNTG